MATFNLTSPEGEQFQVTAPDDATDEQVMQYFQSNYKDTPSERTVLGDVGSTIANIPGSAVNLAGNLASAVIHPIDTAKGLGNLAMGGVDYLSQKLERSLPPSVSSSITSINNAIARNTGLLAEVPPGGVAAMPGYEQPRAAAQAISGFMKDRYGTGANLRNTVVTDPVGVLADAATVLGLGAGALKLAGANNASQVAMRASNAINPVNIAAKALSPVVKGVYTYGIGQTTGSGKRAVEEALKGSKEFVDAMRGTMTEEEILKNSRDAIQGLKDSRSAAYQAELGNLKNAAQKIPINDVKQTANAWLKRYGVRNVNGKLDFSRSTLKDVAATEVQSIYDDVIAWGSKPDDLTPLGLDTLKRRIQNNFVQNSQSRAMATSLSNSVKDKIVQNVPTYAKMTGDYEKSSSVINSIEYALSTKNTAAADTALRKIMTAMRQESGFRRSMLDTLDQQTGSNIAAQAAGATMSNAWSNRLGPMLTTTGAGTAAYLSNPYIIGLLPLASPRVMGEFTRAMGAMTRAGGKVPKSAILSAGQVQAVQPSE